MRTALPLAILSILVGCYAQPSQPNTSAIPAAADSQPLASRHCRGEHHLKVVPCPVLLKNKAGEIVKLVTYGPPLRYSFWDGEGCDYDSICSAVEISPNDLEWRVKPGPSCGLWITDISGENASFKVVGIAYVEVKNEYCKKP